MKVKFVPQDVEFEIQPGQSVMHVAQDHNIYIKSVCKGVPSCAECRVRIVEGEHNVLSPGSEELALIGTGHFIDRRRLSCQLKCFGDITVDMSEQIAKQQGLIGGKKSKRAIAKDDRVEQSVAIRSEDDLKPVIEDDAAPEQDMNAQARPRSQHPGAGQRGEGRGENRGGGQQRSGGGQGGRSNEPRQNQGPRPSIGVTGGPQSSQRPQVAGANLQGEGGVRPTDGEPRPPGEGGPRKRRRRRGGRGGGGGGRPGGGAPQGSGSAP